MLEAIAKGSERLRGEVVLLEGSPGPAFCAGFDLTALDPSTASTGDSAEAALMEATAAMAAADGTFIALIHGHAVGAGVELACACDLRVGTPQTTMRVPASRLGVVYHPRGVARMRRVLGESAVRRMLLLDERLEAEALERAGAIDRMAADADALRELGLELARDLVALDARAVRAHRDALRQDPDPVASSAEARAAWRRRYDALRAEAYAAIADRAGRDS